MDWDKIAASAPINATAATVAGARGQGFTPSVTLQDYWPDQKPMQTKSYYREAMQNPDGNFIDFRGQKFGRLTVLGVLADMGGTGTATWQCRCACGGYCSRRAKSLKILARGGNSIPDRCGSCGYTQKIAMRFALKGKGN